MTCISRLLNLNCKLLLEIGYFEFSIGFLQLKSCKEKRSKEKRMCTESEACTSTLVASCVVLDRLILPVHVHNIL